MYTFDSKIEFGEKLSNTKFDTSILKNEPMLFNCDYGNACRHGRSLTNYFISHLPERFLDSSDLIIDSRVHMLMPNWYPCIPGFHHDDVPRERIDGQPEYDKPTYMSEHAMLILGGGSLTRFALGKTDFPEVPIGKVVYREWHPIVCEKIKNGELKEYFAEPGQMIYFDWNTWHEGTKATASAWRFFIRASRNTGRKPTNELRRQVQVYLEAPMDGW